MKTPEAPSELFRDWQRTQTQSSVTASTARDSKWMSGSAKQESRPRGAYASCGSGMNVLARSSEARVRRIAFYLDKRLTWKSAMRQVRANGDKVAVSCRFCALRITGEFTIFPANSRPSSWLSFPCVSRDPAVKGNKRVAC
jgi:hypothetical protein